MKNGELKIEAVVRSILVLMEIKVYKVGRLRECRPCGDSKCLKNQYLFCL